MVLVGWVFRVAPKRAPPTSTPANWTPLWNEWTFRVRGLGFRAMMVPGSRSRIHGSPSPQQWSQACLSVASEALLTQSGTWNQWKRMAGSSRVLRAKSTTACHSHSWSTQNTSRGRRPFSRATSTARRMTTVESLPPLQLQMTLS